MKRWLVLYCLLGLSTVSQAADLFSVYQAALQYDPTLLAEAASQKATAELAHQATARFLPNAALSANTAKIDSQGTLGERDYNSRSYRFTVTQPLFERQNWVQSDLAEINIRQAQANYDAAKQDLIVRVAERYFNVLASQDGVVFAQAEKTANAKQLEQIQQRFDLGLATITDLTSSQAGYDLAVAEAIRADNTLANSQASLHEIVAQYYDKLAALGQAMPLLSPEPLALDDWVQMALQQNPTLQAAIQATLAAKADIALQNSGHYPSLALVGEHNYNAQNDSTIGGPSKTHQDSITLRLNVPLYEGGGVNSRVRQASHQLSQALQQEEAQRRAIMRESRESYNGVIAGVSRVKALQQAVHSAEKALEATEVGYQVGTRTTTDVLNVRRDLFRAKQDFSRARYDYILSQLRLKQAAGTLNVEDIKQVNQWLMQ